MLLHLIYAMLLKLIPQIDKKASFKFEERGVSFGFFIVLKNLKLTPQVGKTTPFLFLIVA